MIFTPLTNPTLVQHSQSGTWIPAASLRCGKCGSYNNWHVCLGSNNKVRKTHAKASYIHDEGSQTYIHTYIHVWELKHTYIHVCTPARLPKIPLLTNQKKMNRNAPGESFPVCV